MTALQETVRLASHGGSEAAHGPGIGSIVAVLALLAVAGALVWFWWRRSGA